MLWCALVHSREFKMLWVALSMSLAAAEVDAPREEVVRAEFSQGVTTRAPPESEATLRIESSQHASARLLEIEGELRELLVRPSVGEVFVGSIKRLGPWMGIGLIPLAGGIALGYAHVSLTVPQSTSQAILYPVIGIGAFAVSGFLVALFSVVSHFIDEADGAPKRQLRIDALRAERDGLRDSLR